MLRACKRRLGVDDPLLGIELIVQLCKALREGQGAGGACLGESRTKLAAKDRAQGSHRKEEAGIGIDPVLPLEGKRASRDDAVDMAMRSQGLIPGVHDHRAADLPAEVVVSKLDEGLTGGVEQEG